MPPSRLLHEPIVETVTSIFEPRRLNAPSLALTDTDAMFLLDTSLG